MTAKRAPPASGAVLCGQTSSKIGESLVEPLVAMTYPAPHLITRKRLGTSPTVAIRPSSPAQNLGSAWSRSARMRSAKASLAAVISAGVIGLPFVLPPASLPSTGTDCTTRRIPATPFFASPSTFHVTRCTVRKLRRRKKASTGETNGETRVKPQAPVAPPTPSGHYPPEMRTNAPLDVSLREKAKTLFLQGASQAQIAESLGVRENTVKTWAHRYHWPTVKNAVKPILQTLVVKEQVRVSAGIQAGLEEEGRRLRESLSQDLQRTAGRLAGQWTSPDSIREELERSQVVRQVAAVAAQVYGWDRESVTSTVRVGAMGEEDAPSEVQVAAVDDAQ